MAVRVVDRSLQYRRVDELLAARAKDYPDRVEPTWSMLVSSLEQLAGSLRESAGGPDAPEPSPEAQACVARLLQAPVFVVGYQKSGTTLLLNLLDGHPSLGVVPYLESKYFTRFVPEHGHLDPSAQIAALQEAWIHSLINPVGEPPFWLLGEPTAPNDPYERFTAYLYWFAGRYPAQDLLAILATTVVAVRLDAGELEHEPDYWVEKTPMHELHADEILDVYSHAKFLHIVRDPRATVAALRRMEMAGDARASALEIRRTLEAARRTIERIGPGRYSIVSYEELVRDPERVMRGVAAFLDIEFTDILLTPTTAGRLVGANSAWPERRVRGTVHALSVDSWRGSLGRGEETIVLAETAQAANAIGYPLPEPSSMSRVAALGMSVTDRALRRIARS
jgi:sulfotransferase family protein